MSLVTSILTAGTNSHLTTAEEANAFRTDMAAQGVVGTLGNTGGVAPTTGNFSVNAQGTPDMTVAVGSGTAYVTATPSGGNSQLLRVKNSASANVTISANSTGGTRYDWVYLKIDSTAAANPATDGSDVASLVTSRSTSATTDNGTPPSYGINLAVVTVANAASSITNGNIADKRNQAVTTSTTYTPYFALYNFIETGCVWTADSAGSTLNASMTTGYVWIGGKRLLVPSVTARAFTASKDTYVDLKDSGDGVNASINYTEATNNAASSALFGSGTTSDTVRAGIVVSGASSIAAAASINQGQETRVLPIASSVAYSVQDSLGNLIYPTDPQRKILGHRQVLTNQTNAGALADITGLASCPVIIPTGRKVLITLCAPEASNAGIGGGGQLTINDVTASTTLAQGYDTSSAANQKFPIIVQKLYTPSASGARTFKAQCATYIGSTFSTNGAATYPVFLRVELV